MNHNLENKCQPFPALPRQEAEAINQTVLLSSPRKAQAIFFPQAKQTTFYQINSNRRLHVASVRWGLEPGQPGPLGAGSRLARAPRLGGRENIRPYFLNFIHVVFRAETQRLRCPPPLNLKLKLNKA